MNGGRPVNVVAGPCWQKILERIPPPEGGRFYAVGGWSRDRILASLEGKTPSGWEQEIDLVADRGFFPWVEAVFRAFSGLIVGTPHVERDFLTARVDIQEEGRFFRIDLAGFRRESYPRPGVLPRTRPGSFLEDSRRRDFPMNALYLEWDPTRKGFRRLFDPFGGERDLALRRVSLIRPEAFTEDPTRIFRWARLASRLRLTSSSDLLLALKTALEEPALWQGVGGGESLGRNGTPTTGDRSAGRPCPPLFFEGRRLPDRRGSLPSLSSAETSSGAMGLLERQPREGRGEGSLPDRGKPGDVLSGTSVGSSAQDL